jgi:hypothetical protein
MVFDTLLGCQTLSDLLDADFRGGMNFVLTAF